MPHKRIGRTITKVLSRWSIDQRPSTRRQADLRLWAASKHDDKGIPFLGGRRYDGHVPAWAITRNALATTGMLGAATTRICFRAVLGRVSFHCHGYSTLGWGRRR